MNSDPENFERLRQLMALKRHEEPPPGYFDRLPRQVLARIRAGESGGSETSGLQRFWSMIESKSIFAGAFGAAVCALLVSSIVNSEPIGNSGPLTPVTAQTPPGFGASPVALSWQHGESISSNSPISELFNQLQLKAEPASLNFGYPSGGGD